VVCYSNFLHYIMFRKAIIASLLLAPHVSFGNSAQAAGKFYCGNYDGVPSTMTTTKTGKAIPIILWKSNHFSGDGFSPERRCQEVSSRFSNLHSTGRLRLLTTGRMNGMPVICAAVEKGSGCVEGGLLYTLKAGQNAGETLRNLLAIRTKASGPLTETTQRPYISIDEIENAQEAAPTSQAPASVSSQPDAKPAPKATQSNSDHKKGGNDALW